MMLHKYYRLLLLLSGFWFATADAQDIVKIGSDVYLAESSPTLTTNAQRDAFISGFSPTTVARIAGDLHMSGFSVTVNGPVGEDMYAAGSTVTLNSEIGDDATIASFTVTLTEQAKVGANARIFAGTATINGPIAGSLIVSGGEVKLNAAIDGDVNLNAASISFGENARIGGQLRYASGQEVSIPSHVIAAERVQRISLDKDSFLEDAKETIDTAMPSMWPSLVTSVFSFVITIVFLLLVAALCLAFIPETVARLQLYVRQHAAKSLLGGSLGLATLIGLIPVSIMTIVGIPFVLIVLLLIVAFWTFGYLLGTYVISMQLAGSFTENTDTRTSRLLILAGGLVVMALLNFIPIIGWLINFGVMLIGLGAITRSLVQRFYR